MVYYLSLSRSLTITNTLLKADETAYHCAKNKSNYTQ